MLTIIPVDDFHFVPLFASDIDVTCHLDILFLRRSKPGGIVHDGGDVDNRPLTLLDALKAPSRIEELGQIQEQLPKPFYCLMQDDSQISGFSVRTDQLLHPMNGTSADVRLVINVNGRSSASNERQPVPDWRLARFTSEQRLNATSPIEPGIY